MFFTPLGRFLAAWGRGIAPESAQGVAYRIDLRRLANTAHKAKSAAFLRIVGYSREDLETKKLGWSDLTPDEWSDPIPDS